MNNEAPDVKNEAPDVKNEAPDVKKELWREALSWAKTILFALIFAWFFTNFVIVNAHVPTGSMENTIPAPSRIIAFRLSYMFSEPQRGDIIVFR
ncbi:MAG: signal peptidase I, partial [Defluviitaleaceae bacterium]|nr:signal peptidase I [Defluviitaleaceae bacterium]